MRKIDLPTHTDGKWQRWLRDCDHETRELSARVARGEQPTFKSKLYGRRSIRKLHFFTKDAPFYGKCAYCEAPIVGFQHGNVEHFRPKSGVTDERDRVIPKLEADGTPSMSSDGEEIPHGGYYWLAYDHRNLLPSCEICNQPSELDGKKIGKHNRFPVRGRHAQSSQDMASEEPLLIHPMVDDPQSHLSIDTDDALFRGLSDRGSMCIEVFALNARDQLQQERLKACNEVVTLIIQARLQKRPRALAKLEEIVAGKHPYSLAQQAALSRLWPSFQPQGG